MLFSMGLKFLPSLHRFHFQLNPCRIHQHRLRCCLRLCRDEQYIFVLFINLISQRSLYSTIKTKAFQNAKILNFCSSWGINSARENSRSAIFEVARTCNIDWYADNVRPSWVNFCLLTSAFAICTIVTSLSILSIGIFSSYVL